MDLYPIKTTLAAIPLFGTRFGFVVCCSRFIRALTRELQTSVEPLGVTVQHAGTAKELVAFVIDSLL